MKDMNKECISFSLLGEIPDTFQSFQRTLKQLGINAELCFSPDKCTTQMYISWDEEDLRMRRTRNAGRPYTPSSRKWTEIDQWRAQGMDPAHIAALLGVCRSTYYSRLREHKLGRDGGYEYF